MSRVVGIGETGLDYFKLDSDVASRATAQRDSFAAHLDIARDAGLPVIVHTRAAEADTARSAARAHRHDRRAALLHRVLGARHAWRSIWAGTCRFPAS